jgi:type IX secretion system PorP/SprF family membrane protein
MTMKNKILILFTILTISSTSFAQLGTPMSQFSGNQIAWNPGFAGVYDVLSVNLTVHQSWMKIPNAPFMLNFNGHAPFQTRNSAWGWVIQSEKWGPLQGNFIMGNFAHKVYLRNNRILSFGVQAGTMIHTVDWDKLGYIKDPEDPSLGRGRESEAKFDANAGVYYLAPQGYLGFSVRHITNPRYDAIKINDKDWYSQMRSNFLLIAGYNIRVDKDWSLRPELFMRYVHTTPLSANIGAHAHYHNKYSFGINYITGQNGLSFQAKAMITNDLRLGYSYDTFFGTIRPYQQGSHEISVNYMISILRDKARTVDLLWL